MSEQKTGLNIVCVVPMDDGQKARLEEAAPGSSVTYTTLARVSADEAQQADIILGNVPTACIAASPRLKLMQLNSAGADAYLVPGTLDVATTLACARGAYGQAVSEHTLAALLCLMKNLHRYRDRQHEHRWADEGAVTSLDGAQVLVLGAGDIGGAFAKLASGMGAHVCGIKRAIAEVPAGFEAVYSMDELFELLPQMDVVVSFLPSGPTDGLADDSFFAAMKEGSYFVNAGRGGLVDQAALARALADGNLAGASLDVTTPEPLSAASPLWELENLLITPHVAGGYHLPQTLRNVVDICIDNVGRYVRGAELRNVLPHA